MTTIDTAYVAALLEVAERCTGHPGKLANLQGWAIGELLAINEQIKADAVAAARDAQITAAPAPMEPPPESVAPQASLAAAPAEAPPVVDSPPVEAPVAPPTDSTTPTIERRV